MSLTRVLGVFTLSTGGSLLLSIFLIGEDLFFGLTGIPVKTLWLVWVIVMGLGTNAMWTGRRDEQEYKRHEGGQYKCRTRWG